MSRYLIEKGVIVDGTGSEAFVGDVVIEDENIVKIRVRRRLDGGESVLQACLRPAEACEDPDGEVQEGFDRVIDASGLVVCPGFIDIHTHSDLSIFAAPDASAKVLQGVTTDVIGNCSIGPAPLATPEAYSYARQWRRYESSWLGRAGAEWPRWDSWADYSEALEAHDKAINIAGLVGHGPVRASAVGTDDEPADGEQMSRMVYLIEEAMEAGAFGLSTGLTYRPSRYADAEELLRLTGAVSSRGGFYATHIRGEDERMLEAVNEAIDIGRRSDLPVQISHHKAMGRASWGLVSDSLQRIKQVRRDDCDVTVDVYPYRFGGTYPAPLQRLLPARLQNKAANESPEEAAGRRSRIRKWLAENSAASREYASGEPGQVLWNEVYVVEHPDEDLTGQTVAQLAAEAGTDCTSWYIDSLDRRDMRIKQISMAEEDVQTVLKSPVSMVGSDTYAMNATGVFDATWLHPRNFGAFVRILHRYVRQLGLLSWSEAVWKMTGFPARRLGLSDRGLLEEGRKADVVAFSPATVRETATVGKPFSYADGVQWVFVNGSAVVREGEITGSRPGQLLRRA